MFSKKLSALLALGFCATHAAANSMKTVDASDYALKSYNAAVNKPLQVKPNTAYTVDKGSDTVEVDYSIIIQCPQPKKGRMMKRGFITYLSFYDGYDDG
jgi:coenzyme F420-reducing hydrogenase gamma subunit